MTYQGFKIILPLNMIPEKPFVWLQRNGRYLVELGITEVGGLIRIDNFLDDLDNHLAKLKENLSALITRQEAIRTELTVKDNYSDRIEECKNKLEKIDKKLGVDAQ